VHHWPSLGQQGWDRESEHRRWLSLATPQGPSLECPPPGRHPETVVHPYQVVHQRCRRVDLEAWITKQGGPDGQARPPDRGFSPKWSDPA
jgi:endogenous inhibitor of DNA gyrase (YacG/DUF329 family)